MLEILSMMPCCARYWRPCWLWARLVTISIAVALEREARKLISAGINVFYITLCVWDIITWPKYHLQSVLPAAVRLNCCWRSNPETLETPRTPPLSAGHTHTIKIKSHEIHSFHPSIITHLINSVSDDVIGEHHILELVQQIRAEQSIKPRLRVAEFTKGSYRLTKKHK